MDEAFIGEIFLIAFNYAPPGFALCDGQVLSISEYQLLFSLIGTTYGGNGATTFALPDLRGRVPLCVSSTPPVYIAGSTGGNIIKPLTAAHITGHTHSITTDIRMKTGTVANTTSPSNAYPAPATGTPRYSALADDKMMALSVSELGGPFTTDVNATGNFPVNNLMPSLAMNFVIALQGIFPTF